jgi:transcriptional regulator with XRE-family HTH domain
MQSDSVPSLPPVLAAIERRRAAARLTQAQLCEAAKVALSTYWRVMNRVTDPQLGTVERLEAALDAIENQAAEAAGAFDA